MLQYKIVEDHNGTMVTAYIDGELYVADQRHPNFNAIVESLRSDEADPALFDVALAVSDRFAQLSTRVTLRGNNIYFDEDVVGDDVANTVARFYEAGVEDWKPLVNFYEKVATNPNEHSKENLYRWLKSHDFTLTPEGDIVGYKGVRSDLTSINSGPGFVNGQPANGHLDNSVGNVVTMPRSDVQHNPDVSCSTGLHVGTWEYARGFGQVVVKVLVNPRDVVSVPTDYNGQKMRVCRYKVLEILEGPVDSVVDDSVSYEDEECPTCGWELSYDGECENFECPEAY